MEYIEIGKAINTHGLKGELKIESWSDFDSLRYQKGKTVYLLKDGTYTPFKVHSFRVHKGYSLVSFEGYEDINRIESWKGSIVCMDEKERTPLPEGEFYVDELNGFEVIDEEGNHIGLVVDVEGTSGAQNNLRIETGDHRRFLMPNVPAFVKAIDREAKQIHVHMDRGLL